MLDHSAWGELSAHLNGTPFLTLLVGLFGFLGFFDHRDKMSASDSHKVSCLLIEAGLKIQKEIISLVCKFSRIVDICKSFGNLCPIYLSASGNGVDIALIVVIVYMESLQSIDARAGELRNRYCTAPLNLC